MTEYQLKKWNTIQNRIKEITKHLENCSSSADCKVLMKSLDVWLEARDKMIKN